MNWFYVKEENGEYKVVAQDDEIAVIQVGAGYIDGDYHGKRKMAETICAALIDYVWQSKNSCE